DHGAGIVDGRLDLRAVADDRRVAYQPVDVVRRHRGDLADVETPECGPEGVPFPEHDRPAEAGLEHAKCQRFEQRGLVVGASAPDFVVVAADGGISGPGPRAACLLVVPDDDVGAHRRISPAGARATKKRSTASSGAMLRWARERMRAPSSAATSTVASASASACGDPNLV